MNMFTNLPAAITKPEVKNDKILAIKDMFTFKIDFTQYKLAPSIIMKAN